MKTTTILSCCLILMVSAGSSSTPLGTAVTYEGLLTDGGTPVDGTVDLRVHLYAEASGGTPLETSTVDDLDVVEGRLTAVLDFGDEWEGNARWLEIELRDGDSTGAYTPLPERQALLSTPLGLYALDADSAGEAETAASATSANNIELHDADFYRAFTNLTGVPDGIADGDDDTAAGLTCGPGQTPSWNGSTWVCTDDEPGPHLRKAVIGPIGTAAANGAALLDAIGALPAPSSAEDGWLVELEPGRYELGPYPLMLPPWTVLRGGGATLTVINATVCDTISGVNAAVVLQDHTELADLTVENTCASATEYGRGISIPPGSTNVGIRRVLTEETDGAGCTGVLNQGSNTVLERVNGTVISCAGDGAGIMTSGSNALLLDCEASAVAAGSAYGLAIGVQAWVDRGVFTARSTTANPEHGIGAFSGADIRNAIADDVWVGAYQTDQVVTLSRMTMGPVETSDQGGTLLVAIEHSRITASGATVTGDSDTAVGIAMTQLYGDPVSPSGGLIACAGVWDGSWTPYANTCP